MLDEYLKQPTNTVFREKLVNYQFFYQVKLSAACNQSDIKIYVPEIDRDGYDVILDDLSIIKPFQLKAVNKSSTTSEWEVHKKLLLPTPLKLSVFGFEESPNSEGVEGGFILVKLIVNEDSIEGFEYFYTDAYILKAFELGIIKHKNKGYQEKINAFLKKLYQGGPKDKIKLTKCSLVKVASVSHLLALAGLLSIHHNQFQTSFITFIKNHKQNHEREELCELLQKLIKDENIVFSV